MYRPQIYVTLKGSNYVRYTLYTRNGYEFTTEPQQAIKKPSMYKARVLLLKYKEWYEQVHPDSTLHIGGC